MCALGGKCLPPNISVWPVFICHVLLSRSDLGRERVNDDSDKDSSAGYSNDIAERTGGAKIWPQITPLACKRGFSLTLESAAKPPLCGCLTR